MVYQRPGMGVPGTEPLTRGRKARTLRDIERVLDGRKYTDNILEAVWGRADDRGRSYGGTNYELINNPLIVQFDSVDEMVTWCEQDTYNPHHIHRSSDSSAYRHAQAYGLVYTPSKELLEARRQARQGWPAGREDLQQYAGALTARMLKESVKVYDRPMVTTAIAGPMVNIPAFITGLPEAMFDWTPQPVVAPLIHIGWGNTVGGDQQAWMMRGALIVALTDLLENMGRRVELTWYRTMPTSEVRLTLKRPDQPLNLDTAAFMLGNIDAGKKIGWGAAENLPEPYTEGALRRGGSSSLQPMNRGDIDIFIPAINGWGDAWMHEESAVTFMTNILAEQGIEV